MEENKVILAVNGNAVSPTAIQASATIQVGAEVTIEAFGMNFCGVIERTTDGTRMLVSPGGKTLAQTTTLDAVLTACNVSEADKAAVDNALAYVGITSKDFKIEIGTAFYYYSNYAADIQGSINTEYAFSIAVKNTSEPADKPPFKIDSLGIAVWNSTRPGVVNSLGLVNIEDKLKALSS
jgi:hypothetical protein